MSPKVGISSERYRAVGDLFGFLNVFVSKSVCVSDRFFHDFFFFFFDGFGFVRNLARDFDEINVDSQHSLQSFQAIRIHGQWNLKEIQSTTREKERNHRDKSACDRATRRISEEGKTT
jgi:hypothetical protein